MGDHLAILGGLLHAPLNPLKTDVSRGPPGLSGGPGPLELHRNSTTDYMASHVTFNNYISKISVENFGFPIQPLCRLSPALVFLRDVWRNMPRLSAGPIGWAFCYIKTRGGAQLIYNLIIFGYQYILHNVAVARRGQRGLSLLKIDRGPLQYSSQIMHAFLPEEAVPSTSFAPPSWPQSGPHFLVLKT